MSTSNSAVMKRIVFLVVGMETAALAWAAAPARQRLEDYALVLETPAVARQVQSRFALQSAAAATQRRAIRTAQARVESALRQRGYRVTGSVDTLVDAVFVRAPLGHAAEFAALPGVVSVSIMPPMRRALDQAVQFVNVPGAWNAVGGTTKAGAGIKIAILDSGIDQTHPAFQDPNLSMPAGFPKGDSNYTNSKVIVAKSYVATLAAGSDPNNPAADSHPDDVTPRDRSGHGTAVAMIAAGNGVSAPLAHITGVAPQAWLGNYKVFGTPGINDIVSGPVVMQALQDAYNDGMDIAVLPFGGQPVYGPLTTDPVNCGNNANNACDPGAYVMEQAVQTAMQNGMLVVAAAGNDGRLGSQVPSLNTVQTPGIAPAALTVGASTNNHVLESTVRVTGAPPANLASLNAVVGDGPKFPGATPPTTLKDVTKTGDNGLACSPLPAGSLTGAVALIQRGTCSFSTKINNAQNAGAYYVLLFQSDPNAPPFRDLGAQDTGIPAMMISNADGLALKQYLQNQTAQVVLDPTLHAVAATPNLMDPNSSRGPSIGPNLNMKPEVVAVGTDIYTATQSSDPNGDLWDPSGYTGVSGTSFAAAMVGGAAALVKQKTGFSATQLKSAIVDTATTGDISDNKVTSVGGGKLNAGAAVATTVTADPATLSFGAITSGALPISKTITIANGTGRDANFLVGIVQSTPDGNAQVVASASNVAIPAGQSQQVQIKLQGSLPNPGAYQGVVSISVGGSATAIQVPYQYFVTDNVPFSIVPIKHGSFFGMLNDTFPCPDSAKTIVLKLTDRYGVPLASVPVQFHVQSGGGSISVADPTTANDGIAAACVLFGPQAGDQTFTATAGGLTTEFDAYVRPAPAVYPQTAAQPGVVDGASFQTGNLAPGSYISIFGTNLSDASRAFPGRSLALTMAGTSVSFDAPGLSLPGRLSYVSPGQLNVQIPWEFQGHSSVQMKVTMYGTYITSQVVTVPLSDNAPAPFVIQGLAAAVDQNGALVTSTNAARRGQWISVYANGLGPVTNQPASGEVSPPAPNLAQSKAFPTVTIGGVNAPVLWSGLAPGYVGLYQVNVTVPANAPTGTQRLVVTAGGVSSVPVNLPVQ